MAYLRSCQTWADADYSNGDFKRHELVTDNSPLESLCSQCSRDLHFSVGEGCCLGKSRLELQSCNGSGFIVHRLSNSPGTLVLMPMNLCVDKPWHQSASWDVPSFIEEALTLSEKGVASTCSETSPHFLRHHRSEPEYRAHQFTHSPEKNYSVAARTEQDTTPGRCLRCWSRHRSQTGVG